MAAKVETLRVGIRMVPKRRGFVTRIASAAKLWVQRGQLGSSDLEMRVYTGAR